LFDRDFVVRGAEDGSLARTRQLASVLYRWKAWAGNEAPKQFCQSLVSTVDGALQLISAFTDRTVSQTVDDHVARAAWNLRLGNLEGFVDWTVVDATLCGVDPMNLSPEQQRALKAFRSAVDRRLAGKPDVGNEFDEHEGT
jgi:hypothetical protein